jgi:hypothetical protein
LCFCLLRHGCTLHNFLLWPEILDGIRHPIWFTLTNRLWRLFAEELVFFGAIFVSTKRLLVPTDLLECNWRGTRREPTYIIQAYESSTCFLSQV